MLYPVGVWSCLWVRVITPLHPHPCAWAWLVMLCPGGVWSCFWVRSPWENSVQKSRRYAYLFWRAQNIFRIIMNTTVSGNNIFTCFSLHLLMGLLASDSQQNSFFQESSNWLSEMLVFLFIRADRLQTRLVGGCQIRWTSWKEWWQVSNKVFHWPLAYCLFTLTLSFDSIKMQQM